LGTSTPDTITIITTMENTKLRLKAKLLEPALRVGKAGVTENQINEPNKLLNKRNSTSVLTGG